MALAINVIGNQMPPFYVFPRKTWQKIYWDSKYSNAGCVNESGLKQNEFIKFMQHFIAHSHTSKTNPTLLIFDAYASLLSVEALDLAAENGITFLTFPPHCSHRMSPLEVSFYKSIRTFYKSETNSWKLNNHGKKLEMRHIPEIVQSCLDRTLPRDIKEGFTNTGIHPWREGIFTKQDFDLADISGENSAVVAANDANLDYDEQRRIVLIPNSKLSTSGESKRKSNISGNSTLVNKSPQSRGRSKKRKLNKGHDSLLVYTMIRRPYSRDRCRKLIFFNPEQSISVEPPKQNLNPGVVLTPLEKQGEIVSVYSTGHSGEPPKIQLNNSCNTTKLPTQEKSSKSASLTKRQQALKEKKVVSAANEHQTASYPNKRITRSMPNIGLKKKFRGRISCGSAPKIILNARKKASAKEKPKTKR